MACSIRTGTTLLCSLLLASAVEQGASWRMHVIDGTSRGADGVRLGDANRDGRPDIVTGWEEGGRVRLCLHPGPARAKEPWPAVTIGEVASPEDAVLADLDGDGALDVVTCCEGTNRTLFVHWAPRDSAKLLQEGAWTTEAIPVTRGEQAWMFCLPLQVDGRHGVDLVVGSKNAGAAIGWLQAPEEARDLAAWRYHKLRQAGWIMSLAAHDVDGDDDADVVFSDRKGRGRGVSWLENPGAGAATRERPWTEHSLGGQDVEVMFLTLGDLNHDGRADVLAATQAGHMELFLRRPGTGVAWSAHRIINPERVLNGKAVAIGDIDLDGQPDIVHSTEIVASALDAGKPPLCWLSYRHAATDPEWTARRISDRGAKFDLIELLDLDADGDLDVLTCEERANLGVVWFENPTR